MARQVIFDINQKKVAAGSDRRIAQRNKAFAEAWTDPGGMDPAILCTVIDISHTGAKLLFHPNAKVPERFYLQTGSTKRVANVVWRKQNQVGVEFELRRRSDLTPEAIDQGPPEGLPERRADAQKAPVKAKTN